MLQKISQICLDPVHHRKDTLSPGISHHDAQAYTVQKQHFWNQNKPRASSHSLLPIDEFNHRNYFVNNNETL